MLQDTHGWISLHDVARDMGLELTNEQAWAAGRMMEKQWMHFVGTPPLKDNRTKKMGTGSHCFALYPPTHEWRERMARKIYAVRAGASAQMSLVL